MFEKYSKMTANKQNKYKINMRYYKITFAERIKKANFANYSY